MTEVASLIPADHRLTTVKHYEAAPPVGLELVEPGQTFATTKEEEWLSKKKTEVTNTKQIETRVKRQVVLEDGKVVEDSGPMVTTNTTEDTESQEHHQTELRKLGDDAVNDTKVTKDGESGAIVKKSNWIAIPNPEGIVREVKEKKVFSREETEEVKETEDIQHLGDITDEEFLTAVKSGKSDLRHILRTSEAGRAVVSTGPRVVHASQKSQKFTDTEDTRELSSVRPDGKIVTETERTTEHEETKQDELPEGADQDQDFQKESSQRYLRTRDQEDVNFVANGVNIGHEMRFKTETMDVERRGDGIDEPDLFDSLSARARRRANRQPHRYRGIENGVTRSSLDRKDALTRCPLDFDQEEETRKAETSKWLENHFGSESRSSNNSTIDDEEQPPKTSFFNVTIKSQPRTEENQQQMTYVSSANSGPRVYIPVDSERDRNYQPESYNKGITEWSERRQEQPYTTSDRRSPLPYYSPSYPLETPQRRKSPTPDNRPTYSPVPDYRIHHSPTPDYTRSLKISPIRYDNGCQSAKTEEKRERRKERIEEPPPDYSPPSPPPMPSDKRHTQKTRFANDTPAKAKSGNIIGQSIRKLVGKIRSASAERKAKQRSKRSPSPSYQKGHVIDSNITHSMDRLPVQRYYLGEDPFAGSIYGRENKYDGVKPTRPSRRPKDIHDEKRFPITLGRFSKSTSRLVNGSAKDEISSRTLPRHSNRQKPNRLERNSKSNSTINVSIINTVSPSRIIQEGPAKPARTYKSSLSRSKSLNVHAGSSEMFISQPHLHRLEKKPIGLKSPGLISSLNRSQKEVNEEVFNSRFVRNGASDGVDSKSVFLSTLKDGAPELFKTLEDADGEWKPGGLSTPLKTRNYIGNINEPPTRLRDSHVVSVAPNYSTLRRGSTSSTDYSETYHTTTRNANSPRPSIINTTKSFSKKTIPSKHGRAVETIESSETKSVTKSHYSGNSTDAPNTYYEERKYNNLSAKPVVVEVQRYKK